MFLGDDQNAIDEVLFIFKKDTEENAFLLRTAFENNNITQISSVAHKMLPMFRQLEVHTAIPILETFEVLNRGDFSEQQLKAKNIELQREIKKLTEMLSKEISTNPNHNN